MSRPAERERLAAAQDPLGAEAVAAVDRQGMLGDVLAQPEQLADALWRVEAAGVPRRDLPGGLVVSGMGGSAIGADLATAILGSRAGRPLRTVRDYALDPWTGDDTLVLCASYSGNTEETLACYEAAGAVGAPRVAVTTGGRLAEAARTDGVPVIGVPSGMQPRASVVYMTVAALECAALCGAAPSLRDEVEVAPSPLAKLAGEWDPGSPADSGAKALAGRLQGTLPVIHGAGPTAPVAVRWKTQLNENAQVPAFASLLPEASHNEICAWDGAPAPLAAVFLEDREQDERVRGRVEITAGELHAAGVPVERIASRGETHFERVMSLVLLGDLVSTYLAVLRGVDPTPVEPIERLKQALRKP